MPRRHPLALAIFSMLFPVAGQSTVLTVDSLLDVVAVDGDCSLREAIGNANNDDQSGSIDCTAGSGADQIVFDPTVFAGTQTLTLGGGEITISSPLAITGTGRDQLFIDANAASRHFLIDDGSDATAMAVSLSSMTLQNGHVSGVNGGAIYAHESLSLSQVTLTGNTAVNSGVTGTAGGALSVRQSSGAAVDVSLDSVTMANNSGGQGGSLDIRFIGTVAPGTVTLQNCRIEDNQTRTGSGAFAPRAGGAQINIGHGELTMADSSVARNRSEGNIGGIWISAGSGSHVRLDRVQITDNTAGAFGGSFGSHQGGLSIIGYNSDGAPFDVQINDSTISGNLATNGTGGAYLTGSSSGQFLVQRTTVSGNTASGNSGGLNLHAGYSTITLSNSTVSGNTANGHAGGVYAYAYGSMGYGTGRVVIEQSTITGNTANADGNGDYHGGGLALNNSSNYDGEFVVSGTVIANNADLSAIGATPDVFPRNYTIAFSDSVIGDSNGSGLAEAPSGMPDAGNNLIGGPIHGVIDPRLRALADNGGFTWTQLPQPDSPLIDHYAGCSGNDQRGAPHGVDADGMAGNDCDVGAVEHLASDDAIFADGFEAPVIPLKFAAHRAVLEIGAIRARLAAHHTGKAITVARAVQPGADALAVMDARHAGKAIEVRLQRYQHGEWTAGTWQALDGERIELHW